MKKIDYISLYKECVLKYSCNSCIYDNYCDLLDCDAIEYITEGEYNKVIEECDEIETI